MSELPRSRTASLGTLPFGLGADELRHTGLDTLRREQQRLEELLTGDGPATVESFLDPLNRILVAVRDVGVHGGLLFQVHPDEPTRVAGRELSEASDRFFNEFRVHSGAYRRLQGLDLAQEDATTRFSVEKLLREMRRAGVELPAAQREKALALQNRLDNLSNDFNRNISAGQRSILVDGDDGLSGLPSDYRAAHPPGPDGKIRITTRYPDCNPVMAYAADPDLRRRLLLEILNVAFPENVPVLETLLQGRRELVRMLGYPDYAQYAVEDKMTKDSAVVAGFLDRITQLVERQSQKELDRILARKQKDEPDATRLDDWDSRFWTPTGYYDTKLREEEWGVDLRQLRSYLPYPQVRDGLFTLCRELFGMQFRRDPQAEVWHETVEAYDVHRDGVLCGRCYLDLVPRPGKYTHAAQFEVRTGVSGGGLPQGALICNFLDPKTPAAEARMEPSLLLHSEVETFFHEFGHLIHALASGHGRWLYTTQSSVEWDFVEAPSQLFEEWARDPATLARFARNPDTGESIPSSLLAKLRESEAFGRASWALRQGALATLSFELHRRDPAGLDPSALFREVWAARTRSEFDQGYHPVASFGHLTGYSAIYYTYLWSLVIARDLLTPFEACGSLTDPTVARRYLEEVLAPGGSRPAAELVRRFLGRDYSFDAFERWVLAGTRAS
jgi:thimet oligopeptidase